MSSMTGNKTVLDMDQLCFICDTQLSCLNTAIKGNGNSCKFSIKQILKHLKLFPVKQQQNSVNSRCLDDYVVPLCEVCLDTTAKLSKEFGDLEVVEMKISYYLSELYQLLNVKKDHQELETQQEDCNKLKTQIKDKCSKSREQTSMRVILTKLDTNVVNTFKVGQSTSSSDLQKIHGKKSGTEDDFQPEDVESSSTDEQSSEISDDGSDSGSTTDRESKPNQRKRKKKSTTNPDKRTPNYGKCSVCGDQFSNLRSHNVSQHPEVLFHSARLSTISMSDFKLYCNYLVDFKSKLFEYKQVKDSPTGIIKCKCPFCPKRFHNPSFCFRHIYMKHLDHMGKKLQHLQTTISPKQIKLMPNWKRKSGKINSSKITCDCKKDFSKASNFEDHSRKFHPEIYFPSSKADHLTTSQYKMYCVHLLNTETSSSDSSKLKYKCNYCSRKCSDNSDRRLRAHLIKYHHEEISEKLLKLQNDVTVEQVTNLDKIKTPQTRKPDTSYKLQQLCKIKKKLKPEHNCSVCGNRTTSLRKHEAHHHPEKFLKSIKKPEISMEHFKLYCIHLINNQVKEFSPINFDKQGKVKYRCPNCSKLYGDTQSCRNHLVLAHVSALSTDLVKLQETVKPENLVKMVIMPKTLDERLGLPKNEILAGPSVNECSVCGVSLTHRSMVFHMKKSHPIEYLEKYRKFPCKKCGNTYSDRKSLSVHKCAKKAAINTDAKVHHLKKHSCSICKRRFKQKYFLVTHQSLHHIDKLFEKSKSATLSVEQFKIYCAHMLALEIEGFKKLGTKSKGDMKSKCQYCSNTFSLKSNNVRRVHLITKHKDKLKDRLEDLQRSKTLEEIKYVRVFNDRANKPTFWTCDNCSAYFSEYFGFSRHLRFYCKFRTNKNHADNENGEEVTTTRENLGDGVEETQFEATEVFCDRSEAKREFNEEGQRDDDNDKTLEINKHENLKTELISVGSEVVPCLKENKEMEEEILPY